MKNLIIAVCSGLIVAIIFLFSYVQHISNTQDALAEVSIKNFENISLVSEIVLQTRAEIDVLRQQLDELTVYIKETIESQETVNMDVLGAIDNVACSVEDITNRVVAIEEVWEELNFDFFRATSYAPFDNQSGTCNDGDPTNTAIGTYPGKGTFAVDPREIPYYSKMLVIGDGWFEHGQALDTGGAMRRVPNLIDLYRDTYLQTLQFGIQNVIVFWKEGDKGGLIHGNSR